MIRTPYTSDTVVDTVDGLLDLLDLLTARVPQELELLLDFGRLPVLDADGLLLVVDVVADQYWVSSRSWRHGDLDGRIVDGKLGQAGPDEFAAGEGLVRSRNDRGETAKQ